MDIKELPKNPLEVTIKMTGCKWKILIIAELLNGTKRFSEIKKSLKGITQKVLTSKLRELEQDGILTKETSKNKSEYTLTNVGYTLSPVITSLKDWGKDYKKYTKLLSKYNQ
jgi:DNA-binding HxlR family transcriptional regulator